MAVTDIGYSELKRAQKVMKGAPPDWGTGSSGPDADSAFSSRPATWVYRDIPEAQRYELTLLRKSNLRDNDELVPSPTKGSVQAALIDLPFPAEHPYSSHMCSVATFPKFNSPDDARRGINARQKPIHPHMPASPAPMKVIGKASGSIRHEIKQTPLGSEKEALHWPEPQCVQNPKKPSSLHGQLYPTPPQFVHPNLEARTGDMAISERTANALRNVEKNQWISEYERVHSKLGSDFPNKLDDHYEKLLKKYLTGYEDDSLHPHAGNEFTPAVSYQGRFARQKRRTIRDNLDAGEPPFSQSMTFPQFMHDVRGLQNANLTGALGKQFTDSENHAEDKKPDHCDQAVPTERSFDRLENHPLVKLTPEEENSFFSAVIKQKKEHKANFDRKIKQAEALSRWKALQSHDPAHNIAFLNYKYKNHAYEKEHPRVFYNHMGKYNEERSGLYKTSYDPDLLRLKLETQRGFPASRFNTFDSHVDALSYPSAVGDALKSTGQGFNDSVVEPAQLSNKPDRWDVFMPYYHTRERQEHQLLNGDQMDNIRTQEKDIINNQSEYGGKFNYLKLLQDFKLPDNVIQQKDPLSVVSEKNQSIGNVICKEKSPDLSRQVYIDPRTDIVEVDQQSVYRQNIDDANYYANTEVQPEPPSLRVEKTTASPSLNSNPIIPLLPIRSKTEFIKSPEDIEDEKKAHDLEMSRQNWRPNTGVPWPQTRLLDLKNGWSKTLAWKSLNDTFTEESPDLRDNHRPAKGRSQLAFKVF